MVNETKKIQLKLGGLSCSFCASTLEKAFAKKEGIKKATVSLAHNEILVEYKPEKLTPNNIKDTIKDLGYIVRDPDKLKAFEEEEQEIKQKRSKLFLSASFTAAALLIMLIMWSGIMLPWFVWIMFGLALITVFGPGLFILKMAFQSLKRGILNQHVLLEFGAFSGLAGGIAGFFIKDFPGIEFFAVSVFIVTYHILSDFTSLKVRTKASQAVRNLLKLQPSTANVIRNNSEEVIPVEELNINDLIRIRPGENIPVDGNIVEGSSSVDESIVTGESMPVEKKTGDEVIGGSMNKSGTMIVKVTHLGEDSFLQKVAHSIEEARALKPGIILLVDKILKYYVPGVLFFSGLSILIWTAGDYFVTGHIDLVRGILAVLAVFIMGYPCALGMATPLAMIHGGGKAAEKGILVRSSIAFQALKDANIIVFDKTGTITKGTPELTDIIQVDGKNLTTHLVSDKTERAGQAGKDYIIQTAASAEYPSEHPLAEAIVNYADKNNLTLQQVIDFESYPGKGVKAFIENNEILVGSLNFLNSKNVMMLNNAVQISEKMKDNSKTIVGVSENGKLIGMFAIADTIKEDAKDAIKKLKDAGLEPIMITGDNKQTALSVAEQVGIERVEAEVLPENKLHKIRQLQESGNKVIMVGDGINDAPALMQADVGIAIGTGTDIAIESADIVVMGGRLRSIPDVYQIGKNSYNKTVQNLTLAFSFNGIGVPLAVSGLISPIWAMIAMVASVSTVLLNSFGTSIFKSKRNKSKTLNIDIKNIHCDNCIKTIKKVLHEKIKNVKVNASLNNHIIEVTYKDTKITEEGIEEILITNGFYAKVIEKST